MISLKIGIDVDGVLANFNDDYIVRTIKVTGRDLFPPRPFEIPEWSYPERYGYTKKEMSKVWDDIKADPWFWRGLQPYPHTRSTLLYLAGRQLLGDDVYFITARPGATAKKQTEEWLLHQYKLSYLMPTPPTVLISSEKGLCARALKLDIYVDDRIENVQDVLADSECSVSLLDQPWNRNTGDRLVNHARVDSVVEAIESHLPRQDRAAA